MVVIERQASGAWQAIDPPIPLDYGFSPMDFSWRPQPESGLLIFRIRDEYDAWLGQFDLGSGEWSYVLDWGSPIQMHIGSSPRWSSDGDEILYTDPEGDLVIWNYLDGSSTVVGSGTWADWQRDVVVGLCGDGECGGSENQCNCALDCGDHPSDEAGLCTDLADNDCDTHVDCDDSDCDWDEACPFCGDFVCNGDETECSCSVDCGTSSSSEVDLCTDGLDNDCDFVIDCEDTADCADDPACTCGAKGDECTSGADCCSGLCHPVKLECK